MLINKNNVQKAAKYRSWALSPLGSYNAPPET